MGGAPGKLYVAKEPSSLCCQADLDKIPKPSFQNCQIPVFFQDIWRYVMFSGPCFSLVCNVDYILKGFQEVALNFQSF